MAIASPRSRSAVPRPAVGTLAALLILTLTLAAAGAWSFATPSIQAAPSEVTYPLGQIPPDRPVFYRPFDMGWARAWSPWAARPLGIWLVRDGHDADRVVAIFSGDPWLGGAIVALPLAPAEGFHFRGDRSPRIFSIDGTSQSSAFRNADTFRTTIEGDVVRIDVSTLVMGSCPPFDGWNHGCQRDAAAGTERTMRWPLSPFRRGDW
ncbi:MAG: hypothetical protein IT299_08865 [Dehalococcoidia bacterium]|nr:hypothetical protein [Dehalococcoidia bacterium]